MSISSVAKSFSRPANNLFGPLAKGLRRLLLPGKPLAGPFSPAASPHGRGACGAFATPQMSIAYQNQLRKFLGWLFVCILLQQNDVNGTLICDTTQWRSWRQRRHGGHNLTAKCYRICMSAQICQFSWYYANNFLHLCIHPHVPVTIWDHNPHHHSHWWHQKVKDTLWNGPLLFVVVVQLERGFLFVSTILWVEEFKTIKISTVTFMRDFLLERHMTCQVTFTMSSCRL